MAGLLLAWAGPLTRGVGGRDPHDQLITLVVLAPGLLLLRAWRLRAGPLLAAAAVSIAALAVCVLSPTGWSGADVAGGYVLAAGFLVAALRYARTPERRDIVAGGVCLAGVYQFLAGVVPWVQGRDPSAVMTGTFYWHNPYAAFLLPGAVLGLAFAVRGSAPWRLVGWISAPLCTAGIVLSTSRATLAVLVVAWLMVVVPAIVDRRSALRAVGVSIASVVVTFAVTGPPFFPHFSSPFAATTARSKAGESLDSSGHYRTEFWRQALAVGAHHPLWGGGFHSLGTAAVLYTPDWWATTQLAHNGYLQAWTDGGLLLAVPFLVVLAVGAWWALRVTVPGLLRRTSRLDLVRIAAAVAILGGMAHSAVDFDWSHPSVMIEAALLAAVVCADRPPRNLPVSRYAGTAALGCVVVGMAVSVAALHQWQRDVPNVSESPARMISLASSPFGDYRPAAALLRSASTGTGTPTDAELRQALSLTARESTVDVDLNLLRLATQARLGDGDRAVVSAHRLLARLQGSTAYYTPGLATVLFDAGRPSAARTLLASDIAAQRTASATNPDLQAELLLWARFSGTGSSYACELASARPLLSGAQIQAVPSPTATCPAGSSGR